MAAQRGDKFLKRATILLMVGVMLSACTERRDGGECCSLTIEVTVPEGTGTVYLAGSLPELGPWSPGQYAMQGSGPLRSATLSVPAGTAVEYKFTLGSWERQAVDAGNHDLANFRIEVDEDLVLRHAVEQFREDPRVYIDDWQGSGIEGTLVYWTDVESAYLEHSRHVSIWLPPGYDPDDSAGYPVLYMHDGKVLHDRRFGGGGRGDIWAVDEVIVELVEAGRIPPVIVVGAWNSEDRLAEYSPWHGAPDYARFLVEELMPRVNAAFNTRTGPENTSVMGSSMGGLLSYYLVTFHPDAFGACGCISTAFQISEQILDQWVPQMVGSEDPDETPYIVRDIEAGLDAPAGIRYWFDYGTVGGDEGYDVPHRAVRAWLLDEGLEEKRDFVVREYPGADHSEADWHARLADPLLFLYGRPRDE